MPYSFLKSNVIKLVVLSNQQSNKQKIFYLAYYMIQIIIFKKLDFTYGGHSSRNMVCGCRHLVFLEPEVTILGKEGGTSSQLAWL